MFRKLLPRKDIFFTYMATSAAMVVQILDAYRELVMDPSNSKERVERVSQLENDADEHLHKLLLDLERTFITPLDRNEISTISRRLDDIIDLIEGAAQRLYYYELSESPPPLLQLVEILTELAGIVQKAIGGLANLKRADELRGYLVEIHTLENKADGILRPAIGELFRKYTDARDIIKWKEVYEHLEEATDRCEDVADQIENILLEYA